MINLTDKERVIATIKGEKVDYLPFHSSMTFFIREKLAKHFNVSSEDVDNKLNNHLSFYDYLQSTDYNESAKKTKLKNGLNIDEFGTLWDNESLKEIGNWGMIDHPVKDLDFTKYIWPKGDAPGRFDGIEEKVKRNSDKFITLRMTGLFDTAWHITGIQDALMAMADPDLSNINYMLDNSLNFLVGVIRQIPDNVFDSVLFIEDWGSQRGLMMGIDNWRKHLKPRLKELYGEVHAKGLYVHSHSCGDNTELYGDLIELNVNISDPLQPEVMDIEKVKEQFGNDITFMGGLPCQSIIPTGTAKEVYEVTEKTYEILSKGGHYILGGAGAFCTETPVENIMAIVNFYEKMKHMSSG